VHEHELRFRDRREAGRALAERVVQVGLSQPIVLGLPRGGVPVAAEVAARLGAPLDVVVARKVPMPGQPEYAIGAVAEGGGVVVLRGGPTDLGLSAEALARAVAATVVDVRRRVEIYRGGRALPSLAGRTAVVVDDGLATGATVEAAIGAVRAMDAAAVLVAAPVGAPDTVARLSALADVVCLSTPDRFTAVGLWYDDFTQTTDAEVLDLLG
jgi:putative phosphoribosyl transferase